MADFRSRYQPPVDQIIEAARAKASVRDPLAVALDSGMKGLQQGIALSETIGNIQEKRRQRKAMADLLASPEGQTLNQELGGLLNVLPQDKMGDTLLDYKLKKAKQESEMPMDEELKRSRIQELIENARKRKAEAEHLEAMALIRTKILNGTASKDEKLIYNTMSGLLSDTETTPSPQPATGRKYILK